MNVLNAMSTAADTSVLAMNETMQTVAMSDIYRSE
jgi:hypothetical protein